METPEYIKMCGKAVKLQEHEAEVGDWYADEFNGIRVLSMEAFLLNDTMPTFAEYCMNNYVWLPRQDQLQMLSGLSWWEFDKECHKYDAPTKEQAGIQVVIKILAKTIQ